MPIYIAKLPAIEEDLIRIGDFTSPGSGESMSVICMYVCNAYCPLSCLNEKLITRWDSERELFTTSYTCGGQRLRPLNRLPNLY